MAIWRRCFQSQLIQTTGHSEEHIQTSLEGVMETSPLLRLPEKTEAKLLPLKLRIPLPTKVATSKVFKPTVIRMGVTGVPPVCFASKSI